MLNVHLFLQRTSFVDLWNVETKIGHSRLNLISFDFIELYHTTHFEDWVFFYVQILWLN